MKKNFYPVLMCKDLQQEAAFFIQVFSFKKEFDCGWYISLVDDAGSELGMIDYNHDTIPEESRKPCEGLLLNVEVDDAKAVHAKMIDKCDTAIICDIKDEAYGQRHFMMKTPSGVLIDVIEMIQPSKEYLDFYADTSETNDAK